MQSDFIEVSMHIRMVIEKSSA